MHRMTDRADVVLGVDLGTQSCKCIVLDAIGQLLGVGQQGYDLLIPRPHWVEQDPQHWWAAAIQAIRLALRQANISTARVQGIGITGQMHGAVLLGPNLAPLRPAIIWMDRRSANLCPTIQGRVSPLVITESAGNRLSPGFAGASVGWLREVEPQSLDQARVILQPKDYLVLRLTGEISGEPSDASATWLYDLKRRQWSEPLAKACGVALEQLPRVFESAAVVGELRAEAASELGLRAGIPVVAGAGDQAALLLGSGVVEAGRGSITIGTGGQITIVSSRPMIDPHLRLNTFCHAVPDRWYTMGAILNAGIALRWWRNILTPDSSLAYPDLLNDAAAVPPGSEGVCFLPYLEGERTPHMNPDATGAFIGLSVRHSQAHLTRAVLEGVAYAFRDCLFTLHEIGPVPDHFLIGGGGSQGPLWRRIIANVLGVSLQTVEGREHTAIGAALLAGLGAHVFHDLAQAVAHCVHYGPVERPNPDEHDAYIEYHALFQTLYPAVSQGGG
jgi:xylulokinase